MQNVKDAGAHWIARHLAERWPYMETEAISENLDAIASTYEVPIETVIGWIHLLPDDAEFSSETFRKWAKSHAEDRERTLAALTSAQCEVCGGTLTLLGERRRRCLRCGAEAKA